MRKGSLRKIRVLIGLIITGLVISGITAFPLRAELELAVYITERLFGQDNPFFNWIAIIDKGLNESYSEYPFIGYGTDWLAFAHIVIAIAFIGPYRDPVKNEWVLDFGIISSILIFPLAFIAGHYREVPLFWQFIDCFFGVAALFLLIPAKKLTNKLKIEKNEK